jgi:hypothetical protein
MKKIIFISITFFSLSVTAQVTVKHDILPYYNMLPVMPATLEDAYQKCVCKGSSCNADSITAPVKRNLNADMKAMGNMTGTQQQQVQAGTQIAKDAQAHNVNGMTDDQKLQYVKNNPQYYGANAQSIDFAQKMKNDPAEKARLQAMTPAEKLAYLQQNGVLQNNAPAATIIPKQTNDSGKATDALRQQKVMQTNESGDQKNKLTQAWNTQSDMSKINADHAQIDQEESAELNKLPHIGEGGIDISSPFAKAIKKKYMKKHLDLALTEMQNMVKAYQDLYNYYMNAEKPYCNSLAPINYGYTGDPNQDYQINALAIGQAQVLNNISQLADDAKSIYEFAAGWQARSQEK